MKTRGKRPNRKSRILQASLKNVMEAVGPPMTVRQVFYAAVSQGLVEKTEAAYNRIGYQILQMRRNEVIPYSWISDATRWMRKPNSYSGLREFLEITKQTYRRNLWAESDVYVEVWCEKDALAGVLYDVTEEWDVPLMVTRGYPSETFVHDGAAQIREKGKPTYLYYFGDFDPSGQDAIENTRRKLLEFGADFSFEVSAIQEWQIEEYDLPTRPTKRSDSRAKGWTGDSVELDAIPPNQLRALCRNAIEQHVNMGELGRLQKIEQAERDVLADFQASLTNE